MMHQCFPEDLARVEAFYRQYHTFWGAPLSPNRMEMTLVGVRDRILHPGDNAAIYGEFNDKDELVAVVTYNAWSRIPAWTLGPIVFKPEEGGDPAGYSYAAVQLVNAVVVQQAEQHQQMTCYTMYPPSAKLGAIYDEPDCELHKSYHREELELIPAGTRSINMDLNRNVVRWHSIADMLVSKLVRA